MHASSRDHRLGVALTLLPRKPAVPSLATDHGVSITRLAASGTVTTNGKRRHVTGTAWLDHDVEASGPPRPRIGWTRFELQLDDGRDVELFASRLPDDHYWLSTTRGRTSLSSQQVVGGTLEPIGGFIVSAAGHVTRLSTLQISLVLRANTVWHSPHDEASYPALWLLSLDGDDPPIAIAPHALDQEVLPSPDGVAVYVGAVDLAEAEPPGRQLGAGLVQLTGYTTSTDM